LERIWRQAREPETGLFKNGGVGVYNGSAVFLALNQAAFVQMFALIAWPSELLPGVRFRRSTSMMMM
jgi:hypothetical protein